jgi:hypothetical protein
MVSQIQVPDAVVLSRLAIGQLHQVAPDIARLPLGKVNVAVMGSTFPDFRKVTSTWNRPVYAFARTDQFVRARKAGTL